MPELTESTIALRIEKALEVLQLMTADPKLTQKSACERVGIEVRTYRRWITQANDAIVAFQQTIAETERVELSQILIAREQITERLISDALGRHTDPMSRLAIKQYLDKRADELGQRHRGIDHKGVRDMFAGPELSPGENRFVSQNVSVQTSPDGGVQVTVKPTQMVESSFLEDPPPIDPPQNELSRMFGLPDQP